MIAPSSRTVHVVGNLCVDTTLVVPRFPRPSETLVALDSQLGLGGKGVNQAVAAARAGANVLLYAALSFDDIEPVLRVLARDPRVMPMLTGLPLPTDSSTILVRPDGENSIVSAIACAQAFDPLSDGFADRVNEGDIVLMQGNLGPGATRACLAEAKRRGAMTVFNPSPLPTWEGIPWEHVDLVVLNAHELAALSHEADVERGANVMLGRRVGHLVVTRGGHGVLGWSADERIAVDAPRVDVRDTSGAGDVFCGVLVSALARGIAWGEALPQATAAASLSVTRRGALASCPTEVELDGLEAPPFRRIAR